MSSWSTCTTSSPTAGRWAFSSARPRHFTRPTKTKKSPTFPSFPIQYADFAVWQRQWLQGDVLSKQMAFWKKQLGHHPPHLELPTDRPRPPIQTFRGATTGLKLSTELARALRTFTYAKGVTPFMTLLTAFQVLLHRYSGQDEIIVGSPIAQPQPRRNRAAYRLSSSIRFAVRTDFSDHLVFEDLLARARDNLLEAYAHQDLPFEKLVEEIQPERDLSRSPHFPSHVCLPKQPRGRASASRTEFPAFPRGGRPRQIRAYADHGRQRQGDGRLFELQRRSIRQKHHGAVLPLIFSSFSSSLFPIPKKNYLVRPFFPILKKTNYSSLE